MRSCISCVAFLPSSSIVDLYAVSADCRRRPGFQFVCEHCTNKAFDSVVAELARQHAMIISMNPIEKHAALAHVYDASECAGYHNSRHEAEGNAEQHFAHRHRCQCPHLCNSDTTVRGATCGPET